MSSDSQELQPSDHLHPIACLGCRKSHRKCDRFLPVCKECTLKGRECVYPPPMKKGPQPKSSSPTDEQEQQSPSSSASSLDKSTPTINKSSFRHNPYQSTVQPTTHSSTTGKTSNIYHNTTSVEESPPFNYQIIDMYFDVVSVGCPVMQRDAMLSICSKKPQENAKIEQVAMLYAIQALCYQRLGRKQEGLKSFKLARKFLSDVFDILDNFHIAATFLYMANYCIGEGEANQTKYYLHSVQFFIDQNKERLSSDESFGNLCKMFTFVTLLMAEEQTDEGLQTGSNELKSQLIVSERALVLIYQFFSFFTQNMSDGQCGMTVPPASGDMMQEYLVTVTKQATQFNRFQMESSPARSSVTKLLQFFIVDGLRLGVMAKSPTNTDDAILLTANRITNFTTLIYFPYLPSHIINVVSNAARVHLAVLRQVQRGERFDNGIDYFDIIKKDYRALTLLADRYTLVEKKAKTITKQLRDAIVERENQLAQMYNQPSTSNFMPQYSGTDLPNIIPDDFESTRRIEEIQTQHPEVLIIPQIPQVIGQESAPTSPFLDLDFLTTPNHENFYTDPQLLL